METTRARTVLGKIDISWLIKLDALARRALDVLVSVLGLLFLSPFFAVIAIAIKRSSPGPVFYHGPRMGRDYRPFRILKFRTMYEAPESYRGPRITASGDQRITPLGRWLRDTKINELPQLWNVLVGEMSLVGPRPEDPEVAQKWPLHLRQELLSVRPGITSPATVIFREEERMLQSPAVMDDYLRMILPDKLRIDSLYLRKRNLLTDLDVIFMTAVLLLPRVRDQQVPETLLLWGPLAQFISRYLNWFLLDTLVAYFAVGVSGLIWRADAPLDLGLKLALIVALAISLCFSITNALLGMSRVQWRRAPANDVIPLTFSTGLATLVIMALDGLFFQPKMTRPVGPHIPLGMLLVTGLLAYFGFIGLRYRERLLTGLANYWLRQRGENSAVGVRVLLVGAGYNSQFATWLLTRSDLARAFSIVGIVDDDPRKQGMRFDGFRVLGTTGDIPAMIGQHRIGLVLFTISNIEALERGRILEACQATAAKVVILPDLLAEIRAHFQITEKLHLPQSDWQPGD